MLGAAVCASFPVPMFTFSPGELSTIEGLHQDATLIPLTTGTTKMFNFTNVACPPQSVMVGLTTMLQHSCNNLLIYLQEANWYTPEPGQPYRPIIALPRQLRAWNPAFSNCDELLSRATTLRGLWYPQQPWFQLSLRLSLNLLQHRRDQKPLQIQDPKRLIVRQFRHLPAHVV